MLKNSIKRLFRLAEHVDSYSETHKKEINKVYKKNFSVDGGTVTVHIEYQNVPPNKLNESFNLLNVCFTNFYSDFFEMLLANKVSER